MGKNTARPGLVPAKHTHIYWGQDCAQKVRSFNGPLSSKALLTRTYHVYIRAYISTAALVWKSITFIVHIEENSTQAYSSSTWNNSIIKIHCFTASLYSANHSRPAIMKVWIKSPPVSQQQDRRINSSSDDESLMWNRVLLHSGEQML